MGQDAAGNDRFAAARERMVERQIAARGIRDARVLAALRAVPRERFVPADERESAYADHPLPIAAGQTISQPYIVALTCAALGLAGGERVLEIGTGSGYAAAVLARLAAEVHSVERLAVLAVQARAVLAALRLDNVQVHEGDGTLGWAPAAPYDAIAVTAAGPHVPEALKVQLAPGGCIVMPVGERAGVQHLQRWRRGADGQPEVETLCEVRFVPLWGRDGFSIDEAGPDRGAD